MTILATGVTKVSGKAADTSGEVVLNAADVGAPKKQSYSATTSLDLSTIQDAGFYRMGTGVIDGPSNSPNYNSYSQLIVSGKTGSDDTVGQMFFQHGSGELFYRYSIGGSLYGTRWKKLITDANAVGSGGIIERGSNANGEYVKFADGTMICTLSTANAISTVAPLPEDVITATSRYSETWTFPSAFSPAVPTVYAAGVDGGSGGIFVAGVAGTASASLLYITKTDVSSVLATAFRRAAIGRWK